MTHEILIFDSVDVNVDVGVGVDVFLFGRHSRRLVLLS